MTTLAATTRRAIATNDAKLAGRIVDRLRFQVGLNRAGCIAFFKRHAPDPEQFGEPEFENLMQEADEAEGRP